MFVNVKYFTNIFANLFKTFTNKENTCFLCVYKGVPLRILTIHHYPLQFSINNIAELQFILNHQLLTTFYQNKNFFKSTCKCNGADVPDS